MSKFVPERLHSLANLYEERNKLYGDNYKYFGAVMHALFPQGIAQRAGVDGRPGESKHDYFNRVGVLIQVISKLTRYCANFEKGGHPDSLDDIVVYAMMLQELDNEILGQVEEPKPSRCRACETFGVTHRGYCDEDGSLS